MTSPCEVIAAEATQGLADAVQRMAGPELIIACLIPFQRPAVAIKGALVFAPGPVDLAKDKEAASFGVLVAGIPADLQRVGAVAQRLVQTT